MMGLSPELSEFQINVKRYNDQRHTDQRYSAVLKKTDQAQCNDQRND